MDRHARKRNARRRPLAALRATGMDGHPADPGNDTRVRLTPPGLSAGERMDRARPVWCFTLAQPGGSVASTGLPGGPIAIH